MCEERMREAKELQKDFVATIVRNDDDFFIVDWASPKTGNLSTRYFLDQKNGVFVIYGDSGECIASFYRNVTPRKLKSYISDVWYFVEKIRCSTSIYSYDKMDISEDLEELEKQYAEAWEDDAEQLAESLNFHYEKGMTVQQLIYDEFEPVRDYFEYTKVSDDTVYPDNIQDILSKFNPDWWNDGTAPIGRRISKRIYLWITGYEMLCEQLGI